MSDPASAKKQCPWRGWLGFCGNSLTVAWGYFLIAAGATLDVLNALVVMPEVTDLVASYGGPYAPHVIKGFGLVTVVVRLRTLLKA